MSDLGPSTDAATSSHFPPTRLNIATERERLRTVVDVEDKARWRAIIRAKHRLERKKAKEARKLENSGAAPRLLLDEVGRVASKFTCIIILRPTFLGNLLLL